MLVFRAKRLCLAATLGMFMLLQPVMSFSLIHLHRGQRLSRSNISGSRPLTLLPTERWKCVRRGERRLVSTRAGSMSFGGDLAGLSQALLSAGPLGSSLLVLTVVIALHEAGHFIAARSQGIRVKTFSIGFGPKLLSYKPKGGEMSGILWPGGKGSNGQGRPRVESVNGKIVAEEGVEYTLRAIPVGGFVSFPNNWTEDKEGNIIEYEDPDLLQNRGPGQRVVVVVAGIVANLVLAWGCMFGYISTVGVVHQIYSPGLVINEVGLESNSSM
ncbi:unnamed protein product [Choristocarpus tenellus]